MSKSKEIRNGEIEKDLAEKKKKYSNAKFVIIYFFIRVAWINMWHQFMGIRSHSNVKSVTTAVLKKVTWKNMLHQFMRIRNHSNVKFVTKVALSAQVWRDIMNHQFMKKRIYSNVRFVTTVAHKAQHWRDIWKCILIKYICLHIIIIDKNKVNTQKKGKYTKKWVHEGTLTKYEQN